MSTTDDKIESKDIEKNITSDLNINDHPEDQTKKPIKESNKNDTAPESGSITNRTVLSEDAGRATSPVEILPLLEVVFGCFYSTFFYFLEVSILFIFKFKNKNFACT